MSKVGPPTKERARWLLVEGDDDKWVTIELIARHGARWGDKKIAADEDLPYVESTGGIDQLLKVAPVQAKSCQRLAMILDADLAAGDAWAKLRKALLEIPDPPDWLSSILGQIPDQLPREGLVIEQLSRALGVWVMPDNGARGALESFLVDLVPHADFTGNTLVSASPLRSREARPFHHNIESRQRSIPGSPGKRNPGYPGAAP